MENTNLTLEQFIDWLSEQGDIPLQTRIDLLSHLETEERFSEKSLNFIDQYLTQKDTQLLNRIHQLSDELENNQTQLAFEAKQPRNVSIMEQFKNYLSPLVENFKTNFKIADGQWNTKAENTEQQAEQDQIAALKASVGA